MPSAAWPPRPRCSRASSASRSAPRCSARSSISASIAGCPRPGTRSTGCRSRARARPSAPIWRRAWPRRWPARSTLSSSSPASSRWRACCSAWRCRPGSARPGRGCSKGRGLAEEAAARERTWEGRSREAGGSRRLVLLATMMATFMAAMESSIVATAMPTIVAQLGGFRLFSWAFAAYLLTQAVTIPIYGRLADLYGRKRVFFAGASLFLVGSTLCGLARSMEALIAFRALQGLGAGAIQPIATTIVGDIYTPAERARIQGFISGVFGVSAIIGPALGAILVEHGTWPVVFWINLPIGLVAFVMFALFLHERIEPRRHQIDYLGAVLLTLGAGALMTALVQGGDLSGPAIGGLLAVGAIALTVFVAHEWRAAEPILALRLWRNRFIAVGNLGGLALGAVMMGITAFLPTYIQAVAGGSAKSAGLVLTAMSVTWTLGSIVAGRLMIATSYRLT